MFNKQDVIHTGVATTLTTAPFWNDFLTNLWPFLSHVSVATGAFIGVVTVIGIIKRWVRGS